MFVRAYLRASTAEQDAHRARARLDAFAKEHGLSIAARYVENESGAKLARPELFRLLADCHPGDVLLIEQVDRLSRLTEPDYEDRRRRQAEGTAKAKAAGAYKGRRENAARNEGIATMLRTGSSWQTIQEALGCSKGTIAKVRKRLNAAMADQPTAPVSQIS